MTHLTPQQLVERGLEASSCEQATVIVRNQTSANLRWAGNTLTTNGAGHDVGATVIAFDHRADGVAVGSVSGSAVTGDQIAALAEAADAVARAAAPAADAAPLVEGAPADDWSLPPEETTIGVYADFAPALGEAFGRAGGAGRVLYGFVDHDVTTTYVGSSTGLRLRHSQPTGHFGCTGKTADLQQSAWVGGATRDFAGVDPLAMDAELAARLAWGRRSVAMPAGRYDTILPPTAVADLMIDAYWSAAARSAADGQSVFSGANHGTRIGEQLARPGVTMWSDPAHPQLACEPWALTSVSGEASSVFDNGLPLGHTDWISDGRLAALLQTRETAVLTGQPVTPVIDNLILDAGGSGSTADLVADTERGLLLTCLWYIRVVDPQTLLLTGLTRDGVYLVEGGEVTGAVNNFRFNESPVDLLARFSHASATVPSFSREWGDYFSRTATPALRIPDFNMSSVSQAM